MPSKKSILSRVAAVAAELKIKIVFVRFSTARVQPTMEEVGVNTQDIFENSGLCNNTLQNEIEIVDDEGSASHADESDVRSRGRPSFTSDATEVNLQQSSNDFTDFDDAEILWVRSGQKGLPRLSWLRRQSSPVFYNGSFDSITPTVTN
eukprot:TRINITY_DN32505_c0_g1_i2.p1 TRINITY_DN32505_c0_g1~~TRINITY_DN32505_c0_g1_i2.p1  ORF type:complete len:149 (-),score=27.16 TRINITY_DN32505_c0_g1_i2:48-494(-)